MKLANLLNGRNTAAVTLRVSITAALVGASAGVGTLALMSPAHALAPLLTDVRICHATSSASNPYDEETVSAPSIINLPNGHHTHSGDIIPEFRWQDGAVINTYDGKNWGAAGQATWNNGCEPVGNRAPVAVADSATTPFGTAVLVDVLSNDSDADGDSLTAVGATGPSHGTLSAYGATGVTYTPDAGFSGTDTFTYTASDGALSSAAATVTITVSPVGNRAPVAAADSATTPFGTAVPVDVLSNDSDADGDSLSAVGATAPLHGTLSAYGAAGVTYTPDAGFSGTDTFTYTASDGALSSAATTVTITVSPRSIVVPVNSPPNAVDDSVTTPFGIPVVIAVLGNDSDPDGDPLTVTQVSAVARGAVSVHAPQQLAALRVAGSLSLPTTAALVYTPTSGTSGADSFTYTISDGRGGTDEATVSVAVGAAASPSPSVEPTKEPTGEPTEEPSVEPSEIVGTPTAQPATGSVRPTPSAAAGPVVIEEPAAPQEPVTAGSPPPASLPFTGSSTDLLLGLGAGLTVIGLMLALTGRRRRAAQ